MPPVLAAAHAAERWMTAGIVELPTPLQALLAAAGLLVGTDALRTVIPPFWAAYPTIARGDGGALPLLRSDVAARLAPVRRHRAGCSPSCICWPRAPGLPCASSTGCWAWPSRAGR